MTRSIREIEDDYGHRASALLRDWYETKGEIARAPEAVEGPHAGLLTDVQRA